MATIQIEVPTILPARPRVWLPAVAFAVYAAVQLALWGPGWDARSAVVPDDPAFIQDWAIRDLAVSLGRFAIAVAFVALPRTRARRLLSVAVLTGLSAIAFAINVPGIPASVTPIGLMWLSVGGADAMPLWALAGVGIEMLILLSVAMLVRRRDHPMLPRDRGIAGPDAIPAALALAPIVYGVALMHPLEWSTTYTMVVIGLAATFGYARRFEPVAAILGPPLALALLRGSTAIADLIEFGWLDAMSSNVAVFAAILAAGPVVALAARSFAPVRSYGVAWSVGLCAAWAGASAMLVSVAFVLV